MAASSKTVVADGADDGALTKPAPPPPASSLKTSYLALYNFISAVAWLTVLGRVALLLPLRGYPRVFLGVNEFLKWTQTAAILEVVHAALGTSRSSLAGGTVARRDRCLHICVYITPPHSVVRFAGSS